MNFPAEDEEKHADENRRLLSVIQRERRRLFQFIRKRVDNERDAEDILQDVFYQLTVAFRLVEPIEQAGAWLFRVARNRIIDHFRRRRPEALGEVSTDADEQTLGLEDLLPSQDAGPEATYARTVLFEELDAALDELPEEQRDIFVAHEMDGRSFKELSTETGLSINTLLSRKRYAVLHLRRRLHAIYREFEG